MALTRPKIQDLDTTIEYFKDPITTINSGSTQANVDIGFLMNRASGLVSNVALYWSEATQSFRFVYTDSTGNEYPYSNVHALSSANVSAGNVFVNALYYANGQPFVSSSYGNANVATYLLSGANITSNTITISNGIFWPNGNAYSSGTGTGHGVTYTAATVPPISGNTPGDQWYNTTTNVLYEYITDGAMSSWVDVQSPAMSTNSTFGNANVATYLSTNTITIANILTNNIMWPNGTPMMFSTVQNQTAGPTPPLTPSYGTQWYNTTDDTLYEYVNDGTNHVWVDVQTAPLIGNVPSTSYMAAYLPTYTGNITATNVISTFIGNVIGNQNDGAIWTTGNILPSANVTYNIGSPTKRYQSLYLAGNTIDLNGSLIKSDPATGAFALVAAPTVSNPNPVAVIVTPGGGIVNYTTTGGVITTAQIATAVTNAGMASTLNNLNVTSQASLATIVLTNGIKWAGNNQPFASSNYGNTTVASYLASGADPTITGLLTANTTMTNFVNAQVAAIYANTGGEETEIAGLRANIIATNSALTTANTGMLNYVNSTITTNSTTLTNYVNTQVGLVSANVGSLQANSVAQESEIIAIQGGSVLTNAAIVTANTAMKSYVDTANTAMKSYVDTTVSSANTIQSTRISALQASMYTNANVNSYLTSGGPGNVLISSGNISLAPFGPGATTVGSTTAIPVVSIDVYGRVISMGIASLQNLATTASPTFAGVTSSGVINITNSTKATSSGSGALTVTGGAGIGGDLYVQGNITSVTGNINFTGNIVSTQLVTSSGEFTGNAAGFGALYAGISSGFVATPDTIFQTAGNFNGYIQNNFQNINSGGSSTTDWIATANNGTDTVYYVDLGIAGSGYNNTSPNNSLGTSLYPNDSYLYAQGQANSNGGNLVVGTTVPGTVTRVLAGGVNISSVVATFTISGAIINSTTSSTSSSTGALQVAGGLGVTGNINVGTSGSSIHQILGNVVIGYGNGASGALTALEVNVNNATPWNSTSALHVWGSANVSSKVTNDTLSNTSTVGSMYVARTASGTVVSPTAVSNGQLLGAFIARGYGATGFKISNPAQSAGMFVQAAQNFTDTAQGTQVYFNAIPLNSNVAVTGMWIDTTGNVVHPTTTQSTSTTTGAVVVAGGVGIQGNLNVGGNLNVTANVTLTNALPVTSGGTGATTVTQAQTNLNVDPAGTAIAMAIALG
jgi:hypothetical protein